MASSVARPPVTPARAARERRSPVLWLAAYTLWQRELVRFYRQKSRVIGVIASPLLFWIVIGSGYGNAFESSAGGQGYLQFFYPGALVMIVLFTAIFSMMSLIQDRNEGFLLSVLPAPVHRGAIVLGKVLGGATLAGTQGLLFLCFAPLVGVHASVAGIGVAVAAIVMISLALTALGFAIAWRMDSAQAFHAIINLFLLPMWLLSGALFEVKTAAGWLRGLMLANPLTYGMDALRTGLYPESRAMAQFSPATSLLILAAFTAVVFVLAMASVAKRSTKPAA
ncbi:MAG: ABC transporter permease [Acidobacteriales bacterium]|nr:ABC transporter permease [Terriglobales bacterium]